MNGNGRNGASVSPNIDTTIKEIRFKRRDKKTLPARSTHSLPTNSRALLKESSLRQLKTAVAGRC